MKPLFIALLCLPLFLCAQKPEELKHNPTSYVDDFAEIYTPDQERELDGIIRAFKDTVQISIVTVKSLDGIEIEDYALRLGRYWGVGSASNNGLLLLHSTGERKLRTEVGKGLEGDMTDALSKQLQMNYAIPKFKEGKYFEGMRDLLKQSINRLSPAAKELNQKQREATAAKFAQQMSNIKQTLLDIGLWLSAIAIIVLPFVISHRRKLRKQRLLAEEKERIQMENFEKIRREREARWKKEKEERERKSIIENANQVLKDLPPSHQLYRQYSHDVEKDKLVKKYKKNREELRAAVDALQYVAIGVLIANLRSIYSQITYVAPTPQQIENEKQRKRQQEKKDYLERQRRKREEDKNDDFGSTILGAAIGSSLGSSIVDSSSNDSSPSIDSSPSSDFGGGDFGGGGSTSDY